MSKEKEEYKMSAANEAPGSSGPRFKSSSKRRIYIVVGVVCLLIVVAVAIALGVYFGVRGCEMDKITLTVRSSDCNSPVADVIITSSAELTITGKEPGVYAGEVCGMPATLSLQKEGFEPLTATISNAVETVTLTCSEPNCTVQSASISVKSTCATSSVEGVAISGQNVIDVTSSAQGLYQMTVCSLPTLLNLERIGYAAQETTISNGSTVTLLCDSPVIIQDPQSKHRREGEDVTLCCQTEPSTGVAYKWYKDGTELAGKTNNELSLTSLWSAAQGLYQCSAKLTADPSLPAVRSREARLTIRDAASNNCSDAWRPNVTEVSPGCFFDVGQCLKRPCQPGSYDACSDSNVCCETTMSVRPNCAINNLVTKVVSCTCRCRAPTVLMIRGTVNDSKTKVPLKGIAIKIIGTSFNTTINVNGEFSINAVPSSRRRLVLEASDPTGTFLDSYVVRTLPDDEFLEQVIMNIAMIRKAPMFEIDPKIENKLSISNSPLIPNTGSTYFKVPIRSFYNTDGTQYTGSVYVSLTFIDPSEKLNDAPGEFVTLNDDGMPEILVTLGVFSVVFRDNDGRQLLLNKNIEVFAKGSTPYLLWQLDSKSGTWVLILSPPGRKKRQDTQEQVIASFMPQSGKWYNIDYKPDEPECFFKLRVFHSNFSEQSEITNSRTVVPIVRQILSINDGNGIKYNHGVSSTGCFRILCPREVARASISAKPFLRFVETPLRPATIEEYKSGIKAILQQTQYGYTLTPSAMNNVIVNTQMAETGPFYTNESSCEASTFDEPSFWFMESPKFFEGHFYDDSEERCVGKIEITIQSVSDPDLVNVALNSKLYAISVWSNNYGSTASSIYLTGNWTFSSSMFHLYLASCFEYKCSSKNANTSVYFDYSEYTRAGCYQGEPLSPPILTSSQAQEGYYFNDVSNVQEAIQQCKSDNEENFVWHMNCYS